jgi:hypothetical protein
MDSIPENVKERLNAILPGFTAYGFNLKGMSANPNILLANESVIVLRYSEDLHYVLATYDFDLNGPSSNVLKNSLEKIKVIFVRHSLAGENRSAPYHVIPDWVKKFTKVQCLILDNVDLQNATTLEGLNLKFLGILNAENAHNQQLFEVIGKMNGLEFLMYESIFSKGDIEKLTKRLPELITFQLGHMP